MYILIFGFYFDSYPQFIVICCWWFTFSKKKIDKSCVMSEGFVFAVA
jgi:hypothetical protein